MKNTKKSLLLLASAVLILTLTVGGTLAFLMTNSDPVVNTFTPSQTSITVEETFDDDITKSNVYIKNTGEIDAYIRVALVPTWVDDNDNPVGVSASLSDLTIDWGVDGNSGTVDEPGNGWTLGADGFYYYTSKVAAEGNTNNLIASATVKTVNDYKMNLQILAQSIQAQPDEAVQEAWGEANGGSVEGVNDGTLFIRTVATN